MADQAPAVDLGALVQDLDDTFVSRAVALANRLEHAIVGGVLAEGSRLGTKADLQGHFGVAAGTLNEALRILQMRDLIGVRPGPGGGVFVSGSTPSVKLRHGILRLHRGSRLVAQCLAVRNALDELVATEAARSRTARDVSDLQRLLERMCAAKDDAVESFAVNWALHRRIAEAGSNQVLTSIYCALMDLVKDALADVVPDDAFRAQRELTLRVHRRLVEAVASGDPDEAVRAARAHRPKVAPVEDIEP